MNDWENLAPPSAMADILHDTKAAGFFRVSDLLVGSLLRTLAGSKPGGRLLEIGTGTGLGTAWILAGMDAAAHLITVEITASLSAIAQRHLGHDPRVEFVVGDGNQFLASLGEQRFDLIFADGGPGKTENLDRALDALAPGGSYIIDNMLPHPLLLERMSRYQALVDTLGQRADLHLTKLSWSTGVAIAAKRAPARVS